MIKKASFWTGIIGVLLFILTTIIAGFSYPNYSHTSQFISELYAIDAPNADKIRYYFYLPSGILFVFFTIFSSIALPKSGLKTAGFFGIGFGYGIGTIICSIFNCDAGCNPQFINPSLSQFIHNITGMMTYFVVPISILFIGIASNQWKNARKFNFISCAIGLFSFAAMLLLNVNLDSPFKGLIQRIIEGSILIWIVFCSLQINKNLINKSWFVNRFCFANSQNKLKLFCSGHKLKFTFVGSIKLRLWFINSEQFSMPKKMFSEILRFKKRIL